MICAGTRLEVHVRVHVVLCYAPHRGGVAVADVQLGGNLAGACLSGLLARISVRSPR